MTRQTLRKSFVLSAALIALSILPLVYLTRHRATAQEKEFRQLLENYLKTVYARDYAGAYREISLADRKHKGEADYLRENPPFSGTALELTYLLAQAIELRNVRSEINGGRATVRFTVRVPDANDASLQRLVLDFDPDRLARLSDQEKRTIEQKLASMRRQGALPMLEGEDSIELLSEDGRWRVFNDWGGAIRVRFSAEVKEGLAWEFRPIQKIVLAKPGETLQAFYEAKNLSGKPLTAKARHIDRPKEAEKYLEIVQCFCFIQYTLAPGEVKQFPLVFRVSGNAPGDVKEFYVNYQFYPIDKFPKE